MGIYRSLRVSQRMGLLFRIENAAVDSQIPRVRPPYPLEDHSRIIIVVSEPDSIQQWAQPSTSDISLPYLYQYLNILSPR